MINRNTILFLVCLIASGCTTRALEPSYIAGSWEGTGEFYAMFNYDGADHAHLVLAVPGELLGREPVTNVRLSNFQFYDENANGKPFRSIGTYETDEGRQRLDFEGLIRGNTMILFWEETSLDDEDPEINNLEHVQILTRSEAFDTSRMAAKEALDVYRRPTSSLTDNSLISGTWEATGTYYFHLPYGRFEFVSSDDAHMVLVALGAPDGSEPVGIVRLSNFEFGNAEFKADIKTELERLFGKFETEFNCTGSYEHEGVTQMSKCKGLIRGDTLILEWIVPDTIRSEIKNTLVFVRSEAFDVLHTNALTAIRADKRRRKVE